MSNNLCTYFQLFVKLVFEIAVDRKTKTRDQFFEGVPNPNLYPVPVVQPRPYLVNFGPIIPNNLNMPKTKIMAALLVASGLRNSPMNFIQIGKIWLIYEQKTICP